LGLKTYEDIEKHLEIESRNRKEDKRLSNTHNLIFENVSLGGKINKFLRNSSALNEEKSNGLFYDISENEKKFIKDLRIKKNEYKDFKKSMLNDLNQDKSILIINYRKLNKLNLQRLFN
jgi:hypothetical protein